jgi:hypothetical protein
LTVETSMSKHKEVKTDFLPGDRRLLSAVFLGPLAALGNLTVSYTLAPSACAADSRAMSYGTSVAFLAIALFATLIGWRHHTKFAGEPIVGTHERTRWIALTAICLGVFSAVVIVAMTIPNWILRTCD